MSLCMLGKTRSAKLSSRGGIITHQGIVRSASMFINLFQSMKDASQTPHLVNSFSAFTYCVKQHSDRKRLMYKRPVCWHKS